VRDKLGRRLEVGFLQAEGGAEVVVVGKVEATKIVEKCDALCSWVEG
jgi:hypothetical protein